MNLKPSSGAPTATAPGNLNSHLWDYEPETVTEEMREYFLIKSQFPFMGL